VGKDALMTKCEVYIEAGKIWYQITKHLSL